MSEIYIEHEDGKRELLNIEGYKLNDQNAHMPRVFGDIRVTLGRPKFTPEIEVNIDEIQAEIERLS